MGEPAGQFSDWHYMVLRRLPDSDVYHYAQRVVVLMNAKCFSATDIVDGTGVRPDVVVEAAPEDYIGGRDNVLEDGVGRVTASPSFR